MFVCMISSYVDDSLPFIETERGNCSELGSRVAGASCAKDTLYQSGLGLFACPLEIHGTYAY